MSATSFAELAAWSRIVVTGPQRAGTTIAAQMIAADTGHRYVDEAEFGVYDEAAWRRILAEFGVVVQCPHMVKAIVDDPPQETLVVLMRRALADIHASETRIGWEEKFRGNRRELEPFGLTEGDSAALKYAYWQSHPRPPAHLELDYSSLVDHPLYVPHDARRNFGRKHTRPDQPRDAYDPEVSP